MSHGGQRAASLQRLQAWAIAATVMSCTAWAAVPGRAPAQEATTASLISEVRRSFTLGGQRIPPEIFRDFGDGNLADSQPIWVTVDLRAAIGSNLYADDVTQNGNWIIQRKPAGTMNGSEETAYSYVGAAENGLLVVLAAYNGGGSGNFMTLHILKLDAARAFAADGAVYDRIDLTNLRNVPLGDRWNGEIHIAANTIRIVTTRKGPSDQDGTPREATIEVRQP